MMSDYDQGRMDNERARSQSTLEVTGTRLCSL